MKLLKYTALALLGIYMLGNFACSFRISDTKAANEFSKAGVPLSISYFSEGKLSLHYTQTGIDTNATLYFVHGSPGGWNDFGAYMKDKDLLGHFRMVGIDRPGFGYSNFGNAENLWQQTRLLGMLMQHLQNGKPAYLIGHSYGGPLVAALAATYPKAFSGLVILAGSLDPTLESPEKWRPILMLPLLRSLLPDALRASNAELWYLKKDLYRLQQQLPDITCPVYAIHAANDMLVPVKNVNYICQQFCNATYIQDTILPTGNHFLPWNRYETVKKLLLRLASAHTH
ncbi:alpha/beta hydrolase [Sphingobacteriales bacterium UPWRP_1]|nr:hypothetical protein B6N25_06530 [Sphingobacteriales bacterium TSM_CSS]PSJ75478.1 alpha/beta hydrolase [Sphingobacteriales bacterium UPWRP_1]